VTVLFSDIVGFTTMAAATPTAELVMLLNELFTAFDNLCDVHQVFKVETIGYDLPEIITVIFAIYCSFASPNIH
jgi:class 3 adenylate cyclase